MKIKVTKPMRMMMLLFAISYIGYTVPYVLLMPYLQSLGYSSSQQGLVISIGFLVAIIGQMIFGFLCDKWHTIKKMFFIATILLVLATWLFYIITSSEFMMYLAIGSLMLGFWSTIQGLLDSWALEEDEDCKNNYGSIRAFGAIGWIIGGPIIAWIVGQYSYQYLGYIFMIMSIVTLIVAYYTKDANKQNDDKQATLKFSDVKALAQNKRYVLLVVLFFLAYFIMQAEGFLSVQKINAIDASTASGFVSFKSSFQAFFELPFFFLSGYLLKKFKVERILLVGLVAYFLRLGLDLIAAQQIQLVYISSLQFLTFPLLTVSAKNMFYDETPAQLRSSGQQFALAIYSYGSGLLAPLLCGLLIDSISLNTTIIIFTVVALVPIALAVLYGKEKKGVK